MTALAIDTSLDACAVALHGDGVAYERREVMARGHAERLPLMARDALAAAGLAFNDLSAIAVTVGPGTFTGIRIGLAFARGLGLAWNTPVKGFDTLTAIALGIAERPLLVVNEARDDEVYAAYFGGPDTGPEVVKIDTLTNRMAKADCFVTGTSSATLPGRRLPFSYPSVAAMARAALGPTKALPPEPLYLRAADAKPQSPDRLIRPAGPADAAIIADLHARCFADAWTGTSIASLMATPGAAAFIAHERGAPAAFLLSRAAAGETEIISIGVLPGARRRGHARALLRALNGGGQVFIEVAASNAPARALYAGEGFVEVGLRKNYYGGREDAVVMRKA